MGGYSNGQKTELQLDVNQSGFKKGHSTETALLSVTEALRIAKAASKSSVLILLDLSAAFDTVNHHMLMSSLSALGITGTSLHWFESYLTGRSFRVAWRGEVSKTHQLTTGVPQGSVLGPLLFSIYTTSLGHIIQAHGFSYHCYADDTQLFLSFQPDDPTVAARISSCLADISAWMKEHHLHLNLAKTELLVLPANPSLQHDFTIHLDSSSITPSRSSLEVTALAAIQTVQLFKDIKEKDKTFMLDAPISKDGLSGKSVTAVVENVQAAKQQSAAFGPVLAQSDMVPQT
ncbi:hypothetical protein PO909_019963 [Leuciscus waleckii]